MRNPIYLDNNSTTPVDPRVLDEMLPYFKEKFGNPSSHQHRYGWLAEDGVDMALERIGSLIECREEEFIFTSGATESTNLALRGLAYTYRNTGKKIITCLTEHAAVLEPIRELEQSGIPIQYLPVQSNGLLDLNQLEEALKKPTFLVCIMMANNETGVIQPIQEITQLAHEQGSLIFSDASQALGKIPVLVDNLGLDLMACSSHKLYGPKGVGGLYIRKGSPYIKIKPQITGGGQQNELRSGTMNVPGIVGFGKAAEISGQEMQGEYQKLKTWRDLMETSFLSLPLSYRNGTFENRLPHTLNLRFDFIKSEQLFQKIPHIALSTGSACNSANPEPSHVLLAMGLTEKQARSSIRISLGRMNTTGEIENAIKDIRLGLENLRNEDVFWLKSKAKELY